ncbi:uncharacterized protein LOC126900543 isoform X2 [Daktulosphaira vitifoliae]|uniref:uncharacterized protein LOC126900543 isoform X2 n=1 Tax=Daktulosphaira vitifoliae TaxID=58002 RepID=UPI0021AA35B9|nr:uncharacterized protein LOC126900543 isoform X2 [Daktulosphaira vitifoliae]
MVANPKEVLKEFADQSSIHGLHYISDTSRHWTERVFWFVCCALSWYGSYSLMMNSWEAFQTNAISFVVETTALEFQTSFPAISICETDNNNNVQKLATKIYGDHRDYNLDEIVREIAYFKGMCYYIKEFCLTGQYYCPTANFRELALSMRSTCEEVFLNCTWSGVRNFNCCKHFIPTETELGICYTLTMANESPDSDDYINMYSNRLTGPSDIYIKLSAASQVYIHSSVDVPYYNTIATDILHAVPGIYKQYKITIKDIANEDEVQFVGVHQRKMSDNESIIQLMLDQLPQERLKRNVIRGRLDILVSLGGSVALFVGASILSFLEIIYYFFLRMRNVRIESSLTKMSKKL